MSRLFVSALCMAGLSVTETLADDQAKAAGGKPKIADVVYVKMSTSLGDFVLELNQNKAPETVKNFLTYVDDGFYEGTVFHRIIKDFMIQGGGMSPDYNQKPTKSPIKNEADNGLKNVPGAIAMARTGDPHSATSQFFINTVDNSFLNHRSKDPNGWGYCVFGKVVDGMDTVQKIRNTPVKMDPRADGSKPAAALEPVVIKKATRLDPGDPAVKKLAEASRKQEEDAARSAGERKGKAMDEGKNLVKSKGADITKGKSTPTGLWYVDVNEGTGGNPKPTSQVTVHYTGWLTSGGEPFDSSHKRGQPTQFGLNQVIKGWTEGVGGMQKGGKRYLVIPPELAYGERNMGNIPPNSTLVFEVDLLEFTP